MNKFRAIKCVLLKKTLNPRFTWNFFPRSFWHREWATSIGWSYKVSLSCEQPGYCILFLVLSLVDLDIQRTPIYFPPLLFEDWGFLVVVSTIYFSQSSFVIAPTIFKFTDIWQHPAVGSALKHPAAWIWHPKLSTRLSDVHQCTTSPLKVGQNIGSRRVE